MLVESNLDSKQDHDQRHPVCISKLRKTPETSSRYFHHVYSKLLLTAITS